MLVSLELERKGIKKLKKELQNTIEEASEKRSKYINKFTVIGCLAAIVLGFLFSGFLAFIGIVASIVLGVMAKISGGNLSEAKKNLKEVEKIEKFVNSFIIKTELDSILAVLDKNKAFFPKDFEKGFESLIESRKNNLSYDLKTIALKALKRELLEELFKRSFEKIDEANAANTCARILAINYLILYYILDSSGISAGGLMGQYMYYKAGLEQGIDTRENFIKSLCGIAGRVENYSKGHKKVTPEYFKSVIENDEMIKSCTDENPFKVNETRSAWANELCVAPIESIKNSKLSWLDNEDYIDAALFSAFHIICLELLKIDRDITRTVNYEEARNVYLKYIETSYEKLK